jgi:hypothetical protein
MPAAPNASYPVDPVSIADGANSVVDEYLCLREALISAGLVDPSGYSALRLAH